MHFQIQLEHYQLNPQIISTLEGFDLVVCVDFRSPSQAGELEYALNKFFKQVIIFDHHSPSTSEFQSPLETCIIPAQIACAQMVMELLSISKNEISPENASLLAAAIVSDSARFANANSETFRVMDYLLKKSKQSYESLLQKAFPSADLSERVAVIKAMQSPRLIAVGDFLLGVVTAPYSSAKAANTLSQLGADISIGLFRSREFVTAAIRVSAHAHAQLKMDAMELLLPFAKSNNGSCGGHAQAAQITIPSYLSE